MQKLEVNIINPIYKINFPTNSKLKTRTGGKYSEQSDRKNIGREQSKESTNGRIESILPGTGRDHNGLHVE